MNGQRAFSISMKKEKKKTNLGHNNREMDEKEWARNGHINRQKIDENIILKKDDIEELYEQEFGEATKKYNDKQKRKDRKINNYYEHVKDSKKTNEQQEMIVQIGDMDDIELGDLEPEEAKEILQEWYEGFEERNPNLKIYNAVIHMDEATPHMHMNFVPVASGYKRGLEKQVSFDRAIIQQDDELDKKRPFKEWRDKEVGHIAELMKQRGMERKEVGTHEGMTVDRYKEVKDRERAVKESEAKLSNKVDMLRNQVGERNEQFRQAKANLDRRASKLDDRERELDDRENNLKNRENGLNEHIKTFNKHVKTKEQELEEQEKKNKKEANRIAKKSSQVDSKAIQVNNKATQLKRHERAQNEREERLNKFEETLNNAKTTIQGQFERVKDWYKGMNDRTDKELLERKQRNKREIEQIDLTLSDDDLADLSNDKGQQL